MQNYIAFDAYGTLFKLETTDPEISELLGDTLPIILDLWRKKILEYTWLTTLANTWIPFNKIIQRALDYACEKVSCNSNEVIPLLLRIYENPILFDDVLPALEKLIQNGCRLCIISNGERETLTSAVKRTGIDAFIPHIFCAADVKKYKISPMIYETMTSNFHLKPQQVYFTTSNSWDVFGSGLFGFKSVWLKRAGEIFGSPGPVNYSPIHSMAQLPELIKKE